MKKLSNGRERKKNHKAKNAGAGDVRIIGGQ